MINSSVESIIIHTFMDIPVERRDEYLHNIRKLCNTLEQSIYYQTEAELRNIIAEGNNND